MFIIYRRYRDKERSSSPNAPDSVVTSAPTFKSDDKKPISVKAPAKIASSVASGVATAQRTAKKIDLGAASNYGKTSDLGIINSPTHRNTHNEDLFGADDVVEKPSKSNNVIEDIFNDTTDDFDPRAGEPKAADFGDFESAFGGNVSQQSKVAAPPKPPSLPGNDFADFSSAFTPSSSNTSTQPAPSLDNDNFLFNAQPTEIPVQPATNNNLLSADLFGNNVITSAFTSPTSIGNSKDLLSDFGDLTLTPTTPQGELKNQSFIYFFKLSYPCVI